METKVSTLLRQLAIAFDDLEKDTQNQLIYLREENEKLKKQLFIMSSGFVSIGNQLRQTLDVNEIDLDN